MESEDFANKFLRRIREASAAEARQTNKTEVLVDLASQAGLDLAKFNERLSDGSAAAAFKNDLQLVSNYEVRGFPSFLVRYEGKEELLRGYQDFSTFEIIIGKLTGGAIKPINLEKSAEATLKFIRHYGLVAPAEIKESFEYSDNEIKHMVSALLEKKKIKVVPAGNGTFIEPLI